MALVPPMLSFQGLMLKLIDDAKLDLMNFAVGSLRGNAAIIEVLRTYTEDGISHLHGPSVTYLTCVTNGLNETIRLINKDFPDTEEHNLLHDRVAMVYLTFLAHLKDTLVNLERGKRLPDDGQISLMLVTELKKLSEFLFGSVE